MSRPFGRRTALLSTFALGGCKLIDQRTFNPEADRAPPRVQPVAAPAAPPAPPSGPQALVVILLDPAVAYQEPLHDAVALALGRGRRNFEVRTSVPAGAQEAETDAATREAARVADLINRQGGRTVLTAEIDTTRTKGAVLVFVR